MKRDRRSFARTARRKLVRLQLLNWPGVAGERGGGCGCGYGGGGAAAEAGARLALGLGRHEVSFEFCRDGGPGRGRQERVDQTTGSHTGYAVGGVVVAGKRGPPHQSKSLIITGSSF